MEIGLRLSQGMEIWELSGGGVCWLLMAISAFQGNLNPLCNINPPSCQQLPLMWCRSREQVSRA